MAAAPSQIAVKRKKVDLPLPYLNLEERRTKLERASVQYRLEGVTSTQYEQLLQQNNVAAIANNAPRQFQLSTQPTRKRGAEAAGLLPTFEERSEGDHKRARRDGANGAGYAGINSSQASSGTGTPLKRPGSKTLRSDAPKPQTPTTVRTKAPAPEVADALHKFALEEAAFEEEQARQMEADKPKVIVQPKHPIRRLKDRLASPAVQPKIRAEVDTDMSDEEEYVYDIYVRYEQSKTNNITAADPTSSSSVGLLIITEEDEPLWEQYLEEEQDDKEFDTDEEDENAEDYYGADYPEDEVASDDEYGQGAYGYRHGASDDEQYGSDDGGFSDEEDAMRNPWAKAPWLRSGKNAAGTSDDDDDEH